jgi:hypothetical protein
MVNFTIINGTDAQLSNVNAGGIDVPKRSIRTGITLTGAEALVVGALPGVAIMKDAATRAQLRAVAKAAQYRSRTTTGVVIS